MVGWHHELDGHGCGWTPGAGDGQGGLACCGSWVRKESDTTEQLDRTKITKKAFNMLTKLPLGQLERYSFFSFFKSRKPTI